MIQLMSGTVKLSMLVESLAAVRVATPRGELGLTLWNLGLAMLAKLAWTLKAVEVPRGLGVVEVPWIRGVDVTWWLGAAAVSVVEVLRRLGVVEDPWIRGVVDVTCGLGDANGPGVAPLLRFGPGLCLSRRKIGFSIDAKCDPKAQDPDGAKWTWSGSQQARLVLGITSSGSTNARTCDCWLAQSFNNPLRPVRKCWVLIGGASITVGTPRLWHASCSLQTEVLID